MEKNKMKKVAAIKYDKSDEAPTLIAKGAGIIAENILGKAKDEEIPIYKDEKLVETLTKLELGDYIPPELYKVVAEIMVFVSDLDRLQDKVKELSKKSALINSYYESVCKQVEMKGYKDEQEEIGNQGERKAVEFLIKKGYKIIGTNYSCKIGEIDIIAKDNDIIVFIEVKYRKSIKMGRPYESIDYNKQMKIIKTAMMYAQKNNLYEKSIRFDVIEIIDQRIIFTKNAFMLKNNYKYL